MIVLTLLIALHLHRNIIAEEVTFDETFISSPYFVDKSELIKVFFQHNTHKGIFVTRPHGFGKTVNLRMIQKFCQIELDKDTQNRIPKEETSAYKLFKDLKIAKHKDIMDKHLAQHPVLYLDLNFTIEGEVTKQKIIDAFDGVVKKAFSDFAWMKNLFDDVDRPPAPWWNFTGHCDDVRDFSKLLYEYFNGTDVIILIDGHDATLSTVFLQNLDESHIFHRAVQWMLRSLIRSEIRWNILMTGETSLFFTHYDVSSFMHHERFLYDYPYTSYFGFLKEEVTQLLDKNKCSNDEKQEVDKHCGGYVTLHKQRSLYNSLSVTNYLKRRTPGTWNPLPKFQIGKNRTKNLWRFLRHMIFLRGTSKLIKNCPIRHKFLDKFCVLDADKYLDSLVLDPNCTEAHYRIHLTHTFQQGYISPIRQHTYIIPNIEMRNIFLTDLRYHYEDWLEMDIKSLGDTLHNVNISPEDIILNHTQTLQRALTESFQKLEPPTINITNEFIYQSIIHIAALVNPQLTVDEDYPSPIAYDNNKQNVRRRCVTVLRSEKFATIIKITQLQDADVALKMALNYTYNEEGIKCVKHLGINVGEDNQVSLKHSTSTSA